MADGAAIDVDCSIALYGTGSLRQVTSSRMVDASATAIDVAAINHYGARGRLHHLGLRQRIADDRIGFDVL